MGVLDDAFRRATQDLDFGKQRDRVGGFYVRRRAQKLVGQHPDWDSERLTVALLGERATIMAYILRKIDVLQNGSDPKSPAHLDLAVMSKVSSDSGLGFTAITHSLGRSYRRSRTDWIWQIVWRAVALHDDLLWKSTTPPRELEVDALDELVDRRLRVVERMTCNVNTGGYLLNVSDRSWSVAGPNGPWKDRMLVRLFDYPFLPKKPFEAHLMQMPGWHVADEMILYEPTDGSSPVQVPVRARQSWQAIRTPGGAIWVKFKPTSPTTPSDAVRELFELGHDNFLNRSWLYCDMVGAALGIEALWLGRLRRDGNPVAFDAVMRQPDYAGLGAVVGLDGPLDIGVLMADGDEDVSFYNTEVDFSDLQVGDFVCFWNSRIYDLLASGAWRNEYAYVMGVDADPSTGRIRTTTAGPQVWVAGHGLHTSLYNAMATDLTSSLDKPLKRARKRVDDAVRADPAVTQIDNGMFVKWAPYEDFDPPGPWWLMIKESTWNNDWGYPSRDAAVRGAPRTVARDPVPGTGYHDPPDASAIYFPLWEPKVAQADVDGDSWRAYLRQRRAEPAFRSPKRLAEIPVDGRIAPGLLHRGAQTKVPVVRPRVRK